MGSDNIYKAIERERLNFVSSGIELMGEALPKEEGRKLYGIGIEKECSLRRKMHVVAVWLSEHCPRTFEEVRGILDRD